MAIPERKIFQGKSRKILLGIAAVGILLLLIRTFPHRTLEQTYHWAREESSSLSEAQAAPGPSLTPNDIFSILRHVNDPELHTSILDLGLIYDVVAENQSVKIEMTLTVPTCPYGPQLIEDVKNAVFSHPDVRRVELKLTFDPPWSVERITPEARDRILGIRSKTNEKKGLP